MRTAALAAAAAALFFAVYILLPGPDKRMKPPVDKTVAQSAVGNTAGVERDIVRRKVTARAVEPSTGQDVRPEPRASNAGDGSGGQAEINAADYIAALRAEGITDGIAAFPPPGTRPAQTGVIVPDDYELPEGYARHYQSSDDGSQFAAVLTVAPDYELIGEDGRPIELPMDRIVPPEFAPPDLPLRMLEIPSASDSRGGER